MLFRDSFFSQFENREEIYEDKDGSYSLEIPVPGATEKDVTVTAEGSYLTIAATPSSGRRKNTWLFNKKYKLGSDFDSEAISAKVSNGLLTVTIPLLKSKASRQITVAAA